MQTRFTAPKDGKTQYVGSAWSQHRYMHPRVLSNCAECSLRLFQQNNNNNQGFHYSLNIFQISSQRCCHKLYDVKKAQIELCAILANTNCHQLYETRWCEIFGWLSQDEFQTEIAEKLRASPFNKVLSIETSIYSQHVIKSAISLFRIDRLNSSCYLHEYK